MLAECEGIAMKLAPTIVMILVTALLVGCYQVGIAQSRGAKLPRSMKGYELYSWEARREWYFALLIGTNRLKTRHEVSTPQARVRGVEALKRKLDLLAEGEDVLWTTGLVPRTALPPEKIVEEVKSYCDRRGIILRVNRRGVGDASNNGMHPTPHQRASHVRSLGRG
jgi:hypothetical protein